MTVAFIEDRWLPKSVLCLRDYNTNKFLHDLVAGITVGEEYVEDARVHILQDKDIPYYATIFRIHGPFLFGSTDKIHVVTEDVNTLPPVVILRLRNMTALDATGLFAIEEVAKELHESRPHADSLRSAGAAGEPDPSSGVRGSGGRGKYLRECAIGAAEGAAGA